MSHTTTLEPRVAPAPGDGDTLYEVINGQRVEPPPMAAFETHLTTVLVLALGQYLRERQLGRLEGEMLFRIDPASGLERRPDIAFVSFERWPRNRPVPRANAWEIVPDLAVEVISPSNIADDVARKIHDYFRAGVRLVWVIYASEFEVHVYTSPKQVRILDRADTPDGGDGLPGFPLPLAELFEEEGEAESDDSTAPRRSFPDHASH
jgi:Uma2 family endonuclease